MSVSLSRRSLARLPRPSSSSRSYSTMGYVPHQASHDIEPVPLRSKPPPQFFTGNPNFYVAISTLEKTLLSITDRLRKARCFPLTKYHPPQPKDDFKWRSQDEIELLMGVPNIRGLEFKRFERILNRLVRARHACEVATDLESAQRITDLITPFTTPNESKAKAEAIVAKIKRLSAPDAEGRTCTTGTRKKARAQVWMQYTPALAALFHNPAEKDRLAKRALTLELAKAKEEARQVALKEAGAKSLGPVFRELDLQEARKKKERQRAGLAPGPSSPLVVSPIEKVWAAEVEKRERIEKLAREMLKEKKRKELAEADLALSSSSSSSPGEGDTSHMTDDQIRIARIIASDLAKLPSSPYYHHHAHASLPTPLPTDPPQAYLPPTAFETYKSIVTKDLEDLQALKDSRSQVLTPASSNSPERDPAQPKDGTIVVTNTTVVEPASDPTIGQILVNGTPIHRYFPDPKDREIILRPLKVARLLGAFNIFVIAHRGGTTGTAGAIALAIAKGVAIHQPTAKQALARDGLMGVDSRQVERKKTGQPKARKNEVWVKR